MFNSDLFISGATWPVGSVGIEDIVGLYDILEDGFDIPSWPELVGYDRNEYMSDFWMLAFVEWFESDGEKDLDEIHLSRPGFRSFLNRNRNKGLKLAKGQTIGPSTLIKALKSYEYPIVDKEAVINFTCEVLESQFSLLQTVSEKVIVSLDEPSAFLEMGTINLWDGFFESYKVQNTKGRGLALHSCGTPNPEWLQFPWDVVHLDSREVFLQIGGEEADLRMRWMNILEGFARDGKWLALGILPSNAFPVQREDVEEAVLDIVEGLPDLVLKQSFISTSCGIGVRTQEELIGRLNLLRFAQDTFRERIK